MQDDDFYNKLTLAESIKRIVSYNDRVEDFNVIKEKIIDINEARSYLARKNYKHKSDLFLLDIMVLSTITDIIVSKVRLFTFVDILEDEIHIMDHDELFDVFCNSVRTAESKFQENGMNIYDQEERTILDVLTNIAANTITEKIVEKIEGMKSDGNQ